jgi:PAS domain S-box-containing protein
MMGVHRPITETPDILLAAVERANDAVVVLDDDLHVRHFNAAAERIWNLDRAEVLGGHVGSLGVKELEIAQPAEFPRNGDAIQHCGVKTKIRRKDGSRIHVSISVSRVGAGGQSRTIAVVRDISADVELREKLALVSLIADGTNRSVIVADQNLRIVYTNAAFSGMFGYSLEEAKGRHAYQLLVGRHTDRRALVRLRFLVDEKRGGEEEILSYDKNGQEIWISANVRAFRNERGQLKYMCALLTDITETRQLRSMQQ